ncbi:MAG: hypothetical protein ABNG96_06990 [Flavobacterium sp.]|jgi:ABC-type bacteriocin/lantibiotic exporter with double-glycine peptidase domain
MIQLNVSFGIFAFLPQGWIFMAFVILIECLSISKMLSNKWKNWKLYKTVTLSNLISGIIGIIVSMILNGGWWLVVWFPWVSNHEIDAKNPESLKSLMIFYLVAFILSVLIETLINYLILKKDYNSKKIISSTLIVNIISYVVGTIVLYSYSFN